MEQGLKTMEKFVQELRKVIRGSGFEERLFIENFKQRMNRVI